MLDGIVRREYEFQIAYDADGLFCRELVWL